MASTKELLIIYTRLFNRYGPQHWWPGETPFEVMVGAVLTQSAAWTNVEKAIDNLKHAGVLSAPALRHIALEELARLIYPSGYYNAKARKLKALEEWLGQACDDDIDKLSGMDTDALRSKLLAVHGIGPETADSILLYAIGKPVFVIDAYTRRIFHRLGLSPPPDTYDAWQCLFMENLPADRQMYNEYHALLVRLGKETCRRTPLHYDCILVDICPFAKAR